MGIIYKLKVAKCKDHSLFGVLFLAVIVMWWPKQVSAQVQFTPITTNIPLSGPTGMAWGDYDNDNDLDILITGTPGYSSSKIYRNDNGTFTDIGAGLFGVSNGSVAWGDYDKDGDLDILLSGNSMIGLISRIYRNDNGIFTDIAAGLASIEEGAVEWGDYDNDGDLDILMVGFLDISKVYRNDGGIFIDINANLELVHNGSVAWGDYDKDGDLDILLTGFGSANLGYRISWIYRNDNGVFNKIPSNITGVNFSAVAWGDYDNDGDLDILLSGGNGNVLTKVYRNNNGTFTDLAAGLAGIDVGAVAWGDYDNDGDLDVVLSGNIGASGISKVYRNDNGVFTDIVAGIDGMMYASVIWGDYDNDSDLDILISGSSPTSLFTKIYRNDNIVANTAPNAVSALFSTTIQPYKVTLRWKKGTDGQTSKNGLSYNLRIGTSPGAGDILSSQANNVSGYRKIAKIGSIQDTTYTLNLPQGNYYWSVQAIDAGLMGGAWAVEQSFSVSGSATFCQGGSVVLSAAPTIPGATYQWLINGVPIAGATNATYTATTSGSYAVITTSGSASITSAATVVTVKPVAATPTVTASGTTTFCAGGSVNLTAASAASNVTYQWFNNGTAISGATAATYSATMAGSYTVVANANGCASPASVATAVTVTATPATPTITQNGGVLTSSSATGNQWYLNGIVLPGATAASYTVTTNGSYTLQVTTNGCTSAFSAVHNVTNTGVRSALTGNSVEVYPNPATSSFNVKLSGYQKDATAVLYNLVGQLISTKKVTADGDAANFNTKGLATGTYLLKVTSENKVQINRLVIL